MTVLSHGEDRPVRLVASFYERVGEFFNAVEAQLRIKKSVAALAHSDKVYHAKL